MELVILSTLAAVAILIAELRDLVGREQVDRSVAPTASPHLTAVAELPVGISAANKASAANRPELDRAA